VTAIPLDRDVKEIRTGHCGPWQDGNLTGIEVRSVMERVDFVARKLREQAIVEHGARPAEPFLRGLKDEADGSAKIARLREIARCSQEHGGMAIVAASVEPVWHRGAPGEIGFLFHRQGIHICPKPDGSIALALPL